MPSEQPAAAVSLQDHIISEGQVKTCSICHVALTDSSTYRFIPEKDSLVCSECQVPLPTESPCMDISSSYSPVHMDVSLPIDPEPQNSESPTEDSMLTESFLESTPEHDHSNFKLASPSFIPSTKPPLSPLIPTSSVHRHPRLTSPRPTDCYGEQLYRCPDPLADITQHRVRSQAHHCLYPGSIFQGEQKSGKMSYDVTVTIVDVDFTSSFLCGYLTIRNLTEEFPELTTYFDAEIIGSRHGFLTPNSLAEEVDDLRHWDRFPAFRHAKHELRQPRLTMEDRDRGAVFMRWKERFLVPDHRVENISGASFAGFYYVCVDFNPAASAAQQGYSNFVPEETDEETDSTTPSSSTQKETPRTRRGSAAREGVPNRGTSVPTMTGFYHHKNSEPYQRLSLSHEPSPFTPNFEFC